MKYYFVFLTLVFCQSIVRAQPADTAKAKPKPIGSVLRTVREIDMTNDTIPEILQIETTKAKHVHDVKVRFAVYSGKKLLYQNSWKANDFFDPKDKLSDTVKWFRLQRILRVFFSDQNFSNGGTEFDDLFRGVHMVDIKSGSEEAKEFVATPHKIFAVYGGRDMLYGITWLQSKKKFVTLWRN